MRLVRLSTSTISSLTHARGSNEKAEVILFDDQLTRIYSRSYHGRSLVFSTTTLSSSPVSLAVDAVDALVGQTRVEGLFGDLPFDAFELLRRSGEHRCLDAERNVDDGVRCVEFRVVGRVTQLRTDEEALGQGIGLDSV